MGAIAFKNLFNPKVIGIIGNFTNPVCSGNLFLRNLYSSNVENVYKINYDLKEIENFNKDLDLLILTVPLKEIPDILDCIKVKIRYALITSGRVNIDDDFYEGLILERLKRKNIILIGFRSLGFIAVNKGLNISQFEDTPEKGTF